MPAFSTDFADETGLLPALAAHRRANLDVARTPLEALPRLGALLDIALYAKRDDCLTLGMGGNKIRQLEFYLGPALAENADTVLITGAVQSNFVRSCSAAARKLGLFPVVQLEERVARQDPVYRNSGNVLLNRLFGATVHFFPEGEDEAAADASIDQIAARLRDQGRTPYTIHLGVDHPPLGALGYALGAVETFLQFKALGTMPDHVIIPSGSGISHSGFLCGARAIGWDVPVHGICVRRNADEQRRRLEKRIAEVDDLLEKRGTTHAQDVIVDDAMLAPGYGQMNAAVSKVITMAAHGEGFLLDPVYSGRAFAGMADLIHRNVIHRGESVVFIHTGGLPALFAYQDDLAALF